MSGAFKERDVVKENRIKCNKCNEEFQIKDNDFKSNESLKKLLESHSYLSDEEMSFKQKLEESIHKFFEFYDEFQQNRTKLDMDIFEHFHEMRFRIDEHREELKKRIDEIALAMIDQTKKYEALYLKNIKEHFSSYDDGKSLQIKLTEMEDIFRNPHILLESIKDMQQQQEQSLKDIQSKLNEMNRVKEFCEGTNVFQPNSILLDQNEETSLFGHCSLKVNQLTNINSLKSEILEGEQQLLELIKLCEFSPNDKWSLLYRGCRDGFGVVDFHSRCDGRANTLTILKAKQSSYVFGGFTSVEWDSSSGRKSDRNAFIFSLTNKENKPVKIKIKPNQHKYAIYCHSELGPTFGRDIQIANNANTTMESCSLLGFSYNHPQYAHGTKEASTFLAGSNPFQLDEIEIYVRE
jgi:hypothetical protein